MRRSKRRPIEERFWEKAARGPDDECWVWLAAKVNGYGVIGAGGKHGRNRLAHRLSYQWAVGPIPPGLELDHLCRNRACVNPVHLEPVTSAENKRRSPLVGRSPSVNKPGGNNGNGLKLVCAKGHPFDEANTYYRPGGGGRTCRACNRDSAGRTQKVRLDRMIAVGHKDTAA
ncbi:MAG: HNH endonuclease signature motif containing protein [Actinomycetota bacterium]